MIGPTFPTLRQRISELELKLKQYHLKVNVKFLIWENMGIYFGKINYNKIWDD